MHDVPHPPQRHAATLAPTIVVGRSTRFGAIGHIVFVIAALLKFYPACDRRSGARAFVVPIA